MEYVALGNSGLQVSKLSLGSWVSFGAQLGADHAYEIFKRAYATHGINFFDGAETYANGEAEVILGQVVRRGVQDGVWTREDIILSTKVYFGSAAAPSVTAKGLSRKHVVEGTQAALRRLQLDHVDLLFCHRPDPKTPIEETVRAMNHCIDRGYAFYWGTSEWSAAQLQEAFDVADRLGLVRPTMEQPQYNLFHRRRVEEEYAPLYEKYGLGTTIWSPLSSGLLTGKYSGGNVPEGSRFALERYKFLQARAFAEGGRKLDATDKLLPVAEELGCSLSQLAIAWTAANPNVSTVILGASKVSQLDENVKAMEVVPRITPDIVKRIDAIIVEELRD